MFSSKRIKVEITIYDDKFETGRVLTFENLPVRAEIVKVGFPSTPKANIQIFGVSKDKMDTITTVSWKTGFISKKRIRLYTDEGSGYSLLFEGGIMYAAPVYKTAPNIYIQIESSVVAYPNIKAVPPFKVKGEATIFSVIKGICEQYDMPCVNKGVEGVCSDPYFNQAGLANRVKAACDAYGVVPRIKNNRVEVWPKGGFSTRKFTFNKLNYTGYPSFNATGIIINCDTMIDIDVSDSFEIKDSEVTLAQDTWQCEKIVYSLQTLTNGGKWNMMLYGRRISAFGGQNV